MRLLHILFSRLGFVIKRRRPAIPRASGTAPLDIQPANLMQAIHGKDIYEGFDISNTLMTPPDGASSSLPTYPHIILFLCG
jgi:hypothetical protein